MLLASLLLVSVSLCLGEIPNHDETLADRLVLLEKKMMGLEEENKYIRFVIIRSIIFKSFSYMIFKIGPFPH